MSTPVGGDTTSSRQGLVISVTSIGYADEANITYRNTANEGDLVCVSGDLGGSHWPRTAGAGETGFISKTPIFSLTWRGKDYIIERQLKPEARVKILYY